MRASLARSLVLRARRVPVRRAVRRARRDQPRTPQRRTAVAVQDEELRRVVHHPLDRRGGVLVDAGPRDVGTTGPHHRRLRGAVRLSPRATTSATTPSSPNCPARSPTTSEERTHDRRRSPRRCRTGGRCGVGPRRSVPAVGASAGIGGLAKFVGPAAVFGIFIALLVLRSPRHPVRARRSRSLPVPHRVLQESFLTWNIERGTGGSRTGGGLLKLLEGLWSSVQVAGLGLAHRDRHRLRARHADEPGDVGAELDVAVPHRACRPCRSWRSFR